VGGHPSSRPGRRLVRGHTHRHLGHPLTRPHRRPLLFTTEGVKVPFAVTLTSRLGVKHTSTVTKVLLNKCFDMEEDGPNGADLALLILEPPVDPKIAAPTEMMSDDADAVGKVFSYVGWGDHGKAGRTKPPECTTIVGGSSQLNLGAKEITAIKGNVLVYALDAKDDSGAWVEGEAIAWSGDSGGPAFLEDKMVGINSGETCCRFCSADQFARRRGLRKRWCPTTKAICRRRTARRGRAVVSGVRVWRQRRCCRWRRRRISCFRTHYDRTTKFSCVHLRYQLLVPGTCSQCPCPCTVLGTYSARRLVNSIV
jgi:hypothetical protein